MRLTAAAEPPKQGTTLPALFTTLLAVVGRRTHGQPDTNEEGGAAAARETAVRPASVTPPIPKHIDWRLQLHVRVHSTASGHLTHTKHASAHSKQGTPVNTTTLTQLN